MEDIEQSRLEELLMCPVCQDIYNDPRQLPCGHSICLGCLENMKDHASNRNYRCPDCRTSIGEIAHKNYALNNIAEDFRVYRRRREKQTNCVYCDLCWQKHILAIKTCLKCEVSLCKEHVKDHLELPVFTGHPLVEPLGDLLERKCPEHKDAVLRYYCNSSRRYICNICALERKQLNLSTEASSVLHRRLFEYMDQHFKVLQEQIAESTSPRMSLRLNGVTMVLLCLWFIVLYYAYNFSVENHTLQESLEQEQKRIKFIYSTIEGLPMLDMDTVNHFLRVSSDLTTVKRVGTRLNYPHTNNRFDEAPQVLSTQCFSSGTHIWEVEAEGQWDIAVSYKSIPRKSKDSSVFGNNVESWSLKHDGKGTLSVHHNKGQTAVSESLQSRWIAVMVSFEEGSIAFNSTTAQLHKFKATLIQPVCLGLGVYVVNPPSSASIVNAL
ncbi:E3 ubiquitin-protein ligase TRIM58-like isoform X2 [Parambassis ranga]|uniref:E3 ubiquitin-protein ligase TRIM58-like isoform X2 n=1 Tax=Parambassis ranga TaxID=210632 RepID=A0A6P7K487_9TELE|nr:E3 ubiquitin-protein ligase TRIM58-like isoform X2 [Parambassis ranga]